MSLQHPLRVATAAALLASAVYSAPANASIVLNFAGLNGAAEETILNYYNGGFGGDGSGPGPNFGITFGPDAISCNGGPTGTCNVDQIPGGPGSQIAFFLSGPGDLMDKASGFTTGFSFFYSAINAPGSVTVWSGLDGTGTLLASIDLPVTPGNGPGCARPFCPFFAAGVTFSGIAMSADFTGTENQIAFADITLGSATPGAPEPTTWAMMLLGFVGLGGVAGYRRASWKSVAVAA